MEERMIELEDMRSDMENEDKNKMHKETWHGLPFLRNVTLSFRSCNCCVGWTRSGR